MSTFEKDELALFDPPDLVWDQKAGKKGQLVRVETNFGDGYCNIRILVPAENQYKTTFEVRNSYLKKI